MNHNRVQDNLFFHLLVPLFFAFNINAKTISTKEVQFELPESWVCKQKPMGWKCIDKGQKPSDSILTVTQKEARRLDTISSFQQLLSAPKNSKSKEGLPMLSKVLRVRQIQVHSQPWIEALHYQSEIENYYTHYAITLHEEKALLLSFSTHKKALETRKPLWAKLTKSLKVHHSQGAVAKNPSPTVDSGPMPFAETTQPLEDSHSNRTRLYFFIALIALIAGLSHFIYKHFKS